MARGFAAIAAVVFFVTAGAVAGVAPMRLASVVEPVQQTLASGVDDPATAVIERANAHAAKGEYDLALKDFDEALRINPKSAWAYSARGSLYLNMEKTDLAIADLDHALAIDLEFEPAWFNRGIAYYSQGKLDLALRDFDAAISLNPKDADALVERGRCYAALGKPDRALADYAAAIEIAPDNVLAYANRAATYLWMNKSKEAMADCSEALKRDPKNTFALFIRSGIYATSGDIASALTDLDTALAIDPKFFEALRARGMLYNVKGQPQRAIADLDAALALAPNDLPCLKARAEAYYALKRWDLALADFDHIIALKPDDVQARSYRFTILFQSGRGEQARSECQKLIADHPGKGWPYLSCAQIKRMDGDYKGANQDIARAVQIDPSLEKTIAVVSTSATPTTNVPPSLISMSQGARHMDQGAYDEAIEDFERAATQGAPDRDVLPRLCMALVHTKRLDEAAYHCSRALQLVPNDGELLEARGIAYFRQGKYKDALADFSNLVRIFPQNARYLYERGVTKKRLGDGSGDKDIATAKSMKADVENKVSKALAL